MLNTISWQGYWTCIALATISYYLFLRFVYFRENLFNGFRPSGKKTESVTSQRADIHRNSISENAVPIIPLDQIERACNACMDELEAFFEEQKRTKAVKGELLFSLHILVQKYPLLRESEYHIAISNAIKVQCENLCSISLNDEEVKGVWYG